jgi:uncharacterized protein YegJ (DUF2314 family)
MIGVIWRKILGVVALLMGSAIIAWFAYNLFYPTREFQRSFRGGTALVLAIAFILVGWRWLHYEGAGIEDTPGTLICPELVESVAQAKATLPYFIQQVEKNVDGAYVKFPMKTVQGLTEHIWAYVHSYHERKFNVSLANAPKDPKESAQGRRDVPEEDVEDWQILQPDGRLKGAYSTIALFRNRQNNGKSLTPNAQAKGDASRYSGIIDRIIGPPKYNESCGRAG